MIVALAASTAFMTPVSSPVNTLVVAPGDYGFGDFIKVGVPFTADRHGGQPADGALAAAAALNGSEAADGSAFAWGAAGEMACRGSSPVCSGGRLRLMAADPIVRARLRRRFGTQG